MVCDVREGMGFVKQVTISVGECDGMVVGFKEVGNGVGIPVGTLGRELGNTPSKLG